MILFTWGTVLKNRRIMPVDMSKARARRRVMPVPRVGSVDLVNCWVTWAETSAAATRLPKVWNLSKVKYFSGCHFLRK